MIESLVEQIESRFAELSRAMTDPEVIGDRQRYAEVGREYQRLEGPAELAEQWRRAADDAAGAQELLDEGGDDDPELREMLATARRRLEELDEEIRLAMVERDPNDDKDVIVEIQGGAGGEEAGLWAGDLYRMLTKYAERLGFKVQPLEVGDGKYTFAIKGDGAYSVFKYEGGTHRVQRVPATESQGRIHTSTATVAVLPEAEDVDVQVDPNDLQIDVYRSSGPGRAVGQHDRLRRAHHAQAVGHRRLDAGREEPAAEPREGDARAARAPLRAGAAPSSRPSWPPTAARRSAPATAPRRSAPTTTASAASPTTASSSPSTTSTRCSRASSTSSPPGSTADEKRRRLEAQAAAPTERRCPARRCARRSTRR